MRKHSTHRHIYARVALGAVADFPRTPEAVRQHAHELGVSLKPTNESGYNRRNG